VASTIAPVRGSNWLTPPCTATSPFPYRSRTHFTPVALMKKTSGCVSHTWISLPALPVTLQMISFSGVGWLGLMQGGVDPETTHVDVMGSGRPSRVRLELGVESLADPGWPAQPAVKNSATAPTETPRRHGNTVKAALASHRSSQVMAIEDRIDAGPTIGSKRQHSTSRHEILPLATPIDARARNFKSEQAIDPDIDLRSGQTGYTRLPSRPGRSNSCRPGLTGAHTMCAEAEAGCRNGGFLAGCATDHHDELILGWGAPVRSELAPSAT